MSRQRIQRGAECQARPYLLRAGSGPHAGALCLVAAHVSPALGGAVALLTAVVINAARQIEPHRQIARAVLLGFFLGGHGRLQSSRLCLNDLPQAYRGGGTSMASQ